jgi:hypothetical protein
MTLTIVLKNKRLQKSLHIINIILYSVPSSVIMLLFTYVGFAIDTYDIYYIVPAALFILIITASINNYKDQIVVYISTFIVHEIIFWIDIYSLVPILELYNSGFDLDNWGAVKRLPTYELPTFVCFSFFIGLRILITFAINAKMADISETEKY